jgi:hypothetical protein
MAGPSSRLSRELDRSDPFSPSAPLVPEANVSVTQTQQVGSPAWQVNKLVKEDQRLERVAVKAGAKARLHAEANPGSFGMDVACSPERTFVDPVTGEERTFRVVVDNTNPYAESDRKLAEEAIAQSPLVRDARAPAHVVERMTPAEQAERNARRQVSQALTYIPMARLLAEGNAALESAYKILELQGADLSVGTIVTMHEGDSVKVRWDR